MPDLFPYQLESIQAFLLVFTRVTSMIAFMPIIGGQAVPNQMKAGLAALMTIVIFPLVETKDVSVDIDVIVLGLLIVGETMIGLATAFLVNLVFAAVQLAGTIIDFQIGFGITNVVDPVSNASVSVSGQVLNITAMLLFLSLNAHHWILLGLADSFRIIPLGGFHLDATFGQIIIDAWNAVYVTGMQIAAPITVTLLLKQAAMGLIARTVPQMNIFIIGFPITIALGLFTLAVCLPTMAQLLSGIYTGFPEQMRLLYMIFS